MKSYHAITELLAETGVNSAYTLISEDIKSFVAHLQEDENNEIEIIDPRHEQNAVAMADGHARTTDGIGVCIIGRGPAIAQTGTALQTAQKRGSSVLVIVAEPPLSSADDTKEFRQQSFLESLVDDVVCVRSPETLSEEFSNAISRLQNNGGPVVVQLPWDVLDANIDEHNSLQVNPPRPSQESTPPRIEPPRSELESVLELYLDSDGTIPPVILAGRGAVKADAKEELEALAEQTSAMLATTLQAKGYFSDHPFSIGFVGTLGSELANKRMHETDFVYAVGCSLNKHTTDHARLFGEATVIHVDTDPTRINRDTPVTKGVVGDAQVTTAKFIEVLEDAGIDFSGKFWTDNVRKRIAEYSPLDGRSHSIEADRIDPRELVGAIDPILPADRIVVTDAGHFTNWVLDGISVSHPSEFIWTLDFASTGQGLPIGVGAAGASNEKRCHTFCGDGGFMMTVQAIDTAARSEIPITVFVMNDDTLGAEYHQLDLSGKPPSAAVVESPDIETLARSLGAEGHTVQSIDDVHSISNRLANPPDGPLVVDCKIDRSVRHRFFDSFSEDSSQGM